MGPAAPKTVGSPDPPVRRPVGGAASADPQAQTGHLLATLNKIQGEGLGPPEHRVLLIAGRAGGPDRPPEVPSAQGRGRLSPRRSRRPTRFSQVGNSA